MIRASFLAIATTLVTAAPAYAYIPGLETVMQKSIYGVPHASDSFEKLGFGAGYTTTASITYRKAIVASARDDMQAQGSFSAWAKMFDKRVNILEVRGNGLSIVGGEQRYSVSVYGPAGIQLYSNSWNGTFSLSKSFSQTFFRASAGPFWVGPVPVTVSASARGYAGFGVSGDVGVGGINVTFIPRGGADAILTAGPDIEFASAGVRGTLNLVSVHLPVTGKVLTTSFCNGRLAAPKPGISYELDAGLQLESLHGKIELYAEAFGESAEETLGTWSGFDQTFDLFLESGRLCF